MPQMQDEAGNIWEVDGQGNAVRLVQPAGAAAPSRGRVITLPQSAKDQRQESRQDAADRRADDAASRAERASERADLTAQRLADAAERTAAATAKPTEFQSKSAGFLGRMMQAEKDFGAVPEAERGPRSLSRQALRNTLPGVENTFVNSSDRQKADQAVENFIAASLRQESGAAIGQVEFDRQYSIFFPAPGDSADVLTQKADARRQAIEGFRIAAGPLADAAAGTAQQKADTEVPDPTIDAPLKEQPPIGEDDGPPPGEVLLGYGRRGPDRYPIYGKPGTKLPEGEGYEQSFVGQGMSGVNESVAGVLGAPVDVATAAINLIPKGLNALTNSELPTIQDPVLGGEWFRDKMADWAIYDPTDDPYKQFTRRVGESVGAAAIPGMGAGSLSRAGAAILSGLTGGAGGATAQQVAPGNPLAEILGELAGGGIGGFAALKGAQRGAQRQIEAAVPSVEDLKMEAADLYQQAQRRGVTADPTQTRQLADDIRQTLVKEGQIGPLGRITDADASTSKAYGLVEQYADQPMRPVEMDSVRKVLAESRNSPKPADRRLGSVLLDQLDDWARPLAPEFDDARAVSSRYLQAEDLEEARKLAHASNSQFTASGMENALRNQYRQLDKKSIKGQAQFAPEVGEAIEKVNQGTPGYNLARNIGRLAPTGPVSLMTSLGAGGLGAAALGPVGGLAGVTLGGAGMGGRAIATKMGLRNADIAELTARNGGVLDQAPLVPAAFENFAAQLAAIQQAKYLSEGNNRPSRGPR